MAREGERIAELLKELSALAKRMGLGEDCAAAISYRPGSGHRVRLHPIQGSDEFLLDTGWRECAPEAIHGMQHLIRNEHALRKHVV